MFGELQPHDKKEHHVPGYPDVDYVSNDEIVNGKRVIPGETFHTDHSNHPARPRRRRCSRWNCRRAAAIPNTSTCTTPMTTCPTKPSERSTGSRRCTSIRANTARARSAAHRGKPKAAAAARHPPAGARPSRERPQGAVPQPGADRVDHRHGGRRCAGAGRRADARTPPSRNTNIATSGAPATW